MGPRDAPGTVAEACSAPGAWDPFRTICPPRPRVLWASLGKRHGVRTRPPCDCRAWRVPGAGVVPASPQGSSERSRLSFGPPAPRFLAAHRQIL